jgi:hypothetical protein
LSRKSTRVDIIFNENNEYINRVSSVVNILKRTDEIEVQSASFYQTPVIRETIVKKWEDIKIILI